MIPGACYPGFRPKTCGPTHARSLARYLSRSLSAFLSRFLCFFLFRSLSLSLTLISHTLLSQSSSSSSFMCNSDALHHSPVDSFGALFGWCVCGGGCPFAVFTPHSNKLLTLSPETLCSFEGPWRPPQECKLRCFRVRATPQPLSNAV